MKEKGWWCFFYMRKWFHKELGVGTIGNNFNYINSSYYWTINISKWLQNFDCKKKSKSSNSPLLLRTSRNHSLPAFLELLAGNDWYSVLLCCFVELQKPNTRIPRARHCKNEAVRVLKVCENCGAMMLLTLIYNCNRSLWGKGTIGGEYIQPTDLKELLANSSCVFLHVNN